MAVAVHSSAGGLPPASAALAAMDAAQQAALTSELEVIQAKYFSPTSTTPGIAWDPQGDAGRSVAADGASAAGDLFPMSHRLTDSSGRGTDLRMLAQRGPLIVVFFRGTWCTLCCLALRHLSNCLPMLRATYGANLVAISGQLPPHNYMCEATNQLGFPVLCDAGLALAQDLGICYGLTQQESRFYDFICKPSFDVVYGDDHDYRMPLPATFVLEPRSGRIGYAFVDQDLSKRSRLLRIEAALQQLSSSGGAVAEQLPQLPASSRGGGAASEYSRSSI